MEEREEVCHIYVKIVWPLKTFDLRYSTHITVQYFLE